jgi:Domain of unknown function (DUF4173)
MAGGWATVFQNSNRNIAKMSNFIDANSQTKTTLIAAAGLTALADFLLYDGQYGVSLVVLGLAVAGMALVLNRQAGNQRLMVGGGLFVSALLPILENNSTLSILVFLSLSALGTLVISNTLRGGVFEMAVWFGRFFFTLPVRSIIDIIGWRKMARAAGATGLRFAKFGVWIMPIIAGLIFLALFGNANPVIASFIAKIDLWYLLQFLDFKRVCFWAVIFILVWPFLRARLPELKAKSKQEPKQGPENKRAQTLESIIFGPAAILRALIVFNAMFAVQSLLDATYLIGGVTLPDGMTYAAYAHRGAYPLIATALLAAAFVLIAMQEGSAARESGLIRGLVYIWVGQNVLLVLSSILRLDLYIGTYGLTYWRVSALIWMALVAIGLLTIIWRIWRNKNAEWLVGSNIMNVAIALYACCFFNFAGVISTYNSTLERQDTYYLTSLGPMAIPAIDRRVRSGQAGIIANYCYGYDSEEVAKTLAQCRLNMTADFLNDYQKWRLWSLRNWRLKRYLDRNQPPASNTVYQPFMRQ